MVVKIGRGGLACYVINKKPLTVVFFFPTAATVTMLLSSSLMSNHAGPTTESKCQTNASLLHVTI